ncbi:MAG: HNH endonuclease, partial [Verrucomicrobia bacterium]|nr:HNH endonuclease [Verrucomicrobiota bacterium]
SIFARFDWVRGQNAIFVDCQSEHDQKLIHTYSGILNSNQDVAELDSPYSLVLAVEIPDGVGEATGTSNRSYMPTIYSWKLYDVVYFLKGTKPAEAVNISELGLSSDDLLQLASGDRYLAFVRAFEKASQQPAGHYFSTSLEKQLRALEDQTDAQAMLQRKLLTLKRTPATRRSSSPQVRAKIRNEVLQFHNYTCIFDGRTRPEVAMHAHHVIPRRVIERLHLPKSLLTARENLVAACIDCNGAKSDELNPKDIAFYLGQFAAADHPNHTLISLLQQIQRLQERA